jgi:hypothetical protein
MSEKCSHNVHWSDRYAWDKTTGKLSAQPTAHQNPASGVGVFQNRASNPVIQAVSKTATEGILWEVKIWLSHFTYFAAVCLQDKRVHATKCNTYCPLNKEGML